MRISELHKIFLNSSGIATDSRKISGNEMFFALKGENFDGNEFINEALEKGASFVVADDPLVSSSERIYSTKDSLETLQQLAAWHRSYWNGKLLAITGSNGKTTSKELIAKVLSGKYKLRATEGNLNNHIGVPLTLLQLKDEEIAIVEMGANHQGEITLLCDIAKPDVGLITNIGKAHLEGFGSLEGVKKGKGELYDYLAANDKPALVNMSLPELRQMSMDRELEIYDYGSEPGYNIWGELFESEVHIKGKFVVSEKEYLIDSKLFGEYNFMNILTAAAVGLFFDVEPEEICRSISDYTPRNNRSQLVIGEKNTLVLDAYNANPTSMRLALEEFLGRETHPKMLILGEMLELGKDSANEHESILQFIARSEIEEVILVGEQFFLFAEDSRYPFRYFSDIDCCISTLKKLNPTGYLILLKGSRRNALERTTNLLLDC